ncbi:MAG: hypothetical protein EAZ85_06000 [Bacteroidetes bacterium]|nr:MAG: hypothetical protein EAZ85_06000 [Bacteroidota bacterium]TAG92783.1 MAG: hypothetical protein EAZ20_02235 [Bacteroidota bacterium]
MFKIFFYISILFYFSIQITLSQTKTRLVVFSDKSERFWLLVNGKKINEQAAARVVAEDITGEVWQITATFENQTIPDITHEGFRIGNDKEQTYIIRKKRGTYKIKAYGVPQRLFSEMFKNARVPFRIDR